MIRRVSIACTAAILLVAVAGCSSNPAASALTSSMEEATLHGTVRVNGKPVNNGTVSFRTAHINRPNSPTKNVTINKDGSYLVTTVIGENYVEVTCKELNAKDTKKFRGNEQLIMVQSGDNTVDIEIPPRKP
jgi:hypothetical protein